jgi:integrase
MMDEFLLRLKNQKAADRPGRKSSGRVSHKIIRDIHVLLRSAFRQAVVWGNIPKNPLDEAVKPVYKSKKRDFWHPDTAVKAIAHSPDDDFGVCLDIALALSMRIGEILGLRWSCVKFGDVQNGFKGACVRIECELQRVEKDALEALNRTEDLLLVFPNGKKLRKEAKSTLVLKIPKTETSVRTVWIPPALAEKLQKHKERQNKSKEELGDEYTDYDLVIAYNNGRPCEPGRMYKSLRKFSSENGFQKVCFHSFRHTSTSVKLKLSGGDIKSVQGDTGHAQASMVTDIYAEIIDSDRERTAMMVNDLFYPENGVEKNRPLSENETVSLVKRCLQSPDGTKQLLSVISEIIAGGSL